LSWVIKNPAPLDARMQKWGDYHFGRYLTKWLERMGHQVETDYYGQWRRKSKADVVLVLRGRHSWTGRGDAFRVLWIISHPGDVSPEECASYDLVFTASRRHAGWLGARLDVPVVPLLQCVDTEDFKPQKEEEDGTRSDFVFVGNTRNERRESVIAAVESGLDLKVWGRGWERWIPGRFVMADYFDNRKLPGLYAAAKATFNDHWPDMARWGFVNNRVFEALACGLPVVSDHLDEIEELFPGAVLTYRDRKGFAACIERVFLEYPLVLKRVRDSIAGVRENHSFESRVGELVGTVRKHCGS